MNYPVVLDVETKHTFKEFSDTKKLGISVACIYDFKDNKLKSFLESELSQLFSILENSSLIIGFNVVSFDLQVLQGYYPGKMTQFKTFDILEDIREIIGRRLSLNDLVSATLGKKKSGHGLHAIELYKQGKFEELKNYCFDDVILTKELFDFGLKKNEIYYMDYTGKRTIEVSWKKHLNTNNQKKEIALTLPF